MTRIKLALYAGGAFVLAVVTAFFTGRRGGRAATEQRETNRRLDAMREAHEVQDEIRQMGPDDRRGALDRWMRDP